MSRYFSFFYQPGKAFTALIADENRLAFSLKALLLTAILYTFVYVFLIFGGGQPFKPWLNIPMEAYYKYNVFFVAPSMFMGWILAAGVVQLLAKFWKGIGSFEDNLSVLAIGISIASWATLVHDLLTSFLGAIHVINQHEYEIMLNTPTVWRTLLWIQFALYLFAFLFLFSIGIKTAQQIRTGGAIILGFIAFLCYQLFFLIFNR